MNQPHKSWFIIREKNAQLEGRNNHISTKGDIVADNVRQFIHVSG